MLNENNALVRYHFDILVCIALASEVHGICKLEALENNISHNNDIVRHWAFRGLRSAYKMDIISNDFMEWCDNIIHKLEEHTGSSVSFDFDLLETVSALKYVDFGKIHDKEQGQWIRELLIFDLVERLEGSQSQRFQLYKTWLDIEDRAKEKSTRLLKLLHRFLLNMNDEILFDEFYEIIEALNKIDCDTACRILSSSDNKVLFDLRKEYLIVIIKQRLSYVNDCISDEYIQNLALDIMLQLDFSVSRKLLDALQVINNLQSFEEVFNFVVRNEITSHDIYVKNVSLPILKRTLEIKLLGNQIKDTDRLRLGTILDGLLDRNWTFEQLNEFFIKMNQSKGVDKERHFISVLEIILHYKIIPNKNSEKIIKILEKSTECWQKEINEIAVESVFSNQSQIKTSDELVQELHDSNNLEDLTKKHLLHLIESIKNPQLLSELREDPLQNRSNFDLPISQWNEDLIGQWANLIKKNHEKYCKDFDKFIIETLAVIKQASLKDTGFHLTDAQILGCLLILNSKKNQGRLLQVGTGEGKSTIISALAVFYALQGRKVDIITSSPVLAERDAKEKQKFYNMFSIGCSPNNDKAVYISGAKKCYKKEIVYGELAQFQFDTLRTEYAQLYTLGGRTCDVAIVDEVDSMLIDDGSKIARLASSVSGLDQLQIIYHLLWNQLVFIRGKIILINDKMYLFYGKIQFKEKNIVLEYESENGDLTIISDLKAYLQSTSDIRNIGVRIPDDDQGDAFIKKNLDDYIRKYIVENMKIPINFLEFIDTQIPKWIDSAITAMAYQENVHYVVHEGLIKPVDYFSTGIVQGSSNWSDGLHQFLQIKHELRMTSETFTTNFLSNKAYLTRYGLNLFGLTGTLGSEKAKEVLADAYNVDSVIIPSLRQKQHLSLPDIVVTSEQDWLRQICRSAQNESIKGRGTLIICETIEYCKLLAENLQEKYHLRAIKIYTMNNINQEKNVENVSQGEIIVATNLAGRGTDIKTEDIEKYGGLHVIITFIPPNKRVEEQAIGRTSRQGKRGTSQRILNVASLVQNKDFDVQKITQFRDGIEAQMLDEFSKNELQSINLKDELFSKFCVLINELRERIRKDAGYLSDAWHCVKNKLGYFKPSVVELNTLLSVEERWAMFLRKIDNDQSPIDSERINNEFEIFSEEIRNDHKKDCLMRNPYHHIAIGNDLILNDSSLNSKYELALKHFDKAIELDSNYCAAAFVGRGWLLVKGKEKLIVSNTQEFGYKEAAIRSFRCALEILAEEMSSLSAIQTLLQHRSSNANSLLSKQLLQKVNILDVTKKVALSELKDRSSFRVNLEIRGVEMAPIKQENIEINNVKSLRELFMNDARPDLELAEYSARGIEYILQTSEKGFIPWLSIGILTCIATLQIGLGALFITTAFGASLGMNVITEGVADIFYAYRTSRSRQFSWIDYGKQKAVSLIISAVTLGFSSFKDAAKGAQTLVQGAEREALEQAGTRLIMNGKSSGATLIKTGKNFQSLAVKYISVSFGEAAVKEGLNAVADIGSNFALEQLKPQISASIQDKITNKFCQPDLLKILRKMFAIDLINKQQKLKDKINKIVGDIINPRHSFWRRQWESVGGPLCKGILSSAEKIRSPASMAIRIIGILNGMHEIISLIDNIYNQLLEELRQIDHDYLSMHRILHDYCEIAEQNTTGIVTIFSKNGIQEINDALADKCFQSKLKNISFNEFETVKPRVVEFLTSLNKKMLDLQIDDFSEIMKSVSDVVTEQILRISQSQLISPFSTFVVSELTNAISERIQHHFIVDQNQNSDSQNQEINENKNYGYNTISKQIQGNAKDYTIAYSQCEIIYHALQSKLSGNHRGKLNNETEEYVKGVRNDKPASLADMMGLAASYGLDIKIVDDENYIPTEDDKEKGTHIIVFSPGERDGQGNIDIGHYRLMQDDDTDNHNRREKNDCGYVVIQKILSEQGVGKTIEDLRNDCAQSIKDSPQLFLTAHQAQTWVEARYPVNANSLLFIGGTASNQRPRFELNPNNPWVGIYGELDDPWYGRKCQYELNHIPPLDALKGTDF
ncbi:unnamed protein product, partial [Rotaria sp. Silwood1]